MSRIVLGGGLSGLAAAYYASKQALNNPVVVLEATDRLGGWLKTTRLADGTLFEQSARTIRPSGKTGANTLRLIEELGIGAEVVPVRLSSPAARNRMIFVDGKLHSLPNSFSGLFVRQKPFSKPLIFSFLNDLITPKKNVWEGDESVYSFASRRFGMEVANYLISPIVCGICGGDAREISVKFLMKSLFEKEQKYGGVLRGIVYETLHKKPKEKFPSSRLLKQSKSEKWNVYSFRNGIETLPKALKYNIKSRGVEIKTNHTITDLELNKHSVVCRLDNGDCIVGNRLVSCIPAFELSNVIKTHHPELSELLSNIKSASMCVVNLKYDGNVLTKEGFGFLVGPQEESPLLGVIFDSCCFPHTTGTVLTAMVGGYKYDRYINENSTEEDVTKLVLDEVNRVLRINDIPSSVKVQFLSNSIPQYTVGHEKTIKSIENYIKNHDLPLSLCGASYYGVGVNDVIYSAKKAVDETTD